MSTGLKLSSDQRSICRPTEEGTNPVALCIEPFCATRQYFEVYISSVGSWLGIGTTESTIKFCSQKVLGDQLDCFNASYFVQETGSIRCAVERVLLRAPSVQKGDLLGVEMNQVQNVIRFYRNR
jgi:hypothetical protein